MAAHDPGPSAAPGVQLAQVPEPEGLRHALRALAEESPQRAAEVLADPDGLAAHVWRRWHTPRQRAGLSHHEFLDILVGYQREL